jgi:hypothetical protein
MEVLTVALRLTELNFTFKVNTVFCRLDHSTTPDMLLLDIQCALDKLHAFEHRDSFRCD